ncbi:DUF4105 domain-containing protein [Methyloprofundus sp.]|uniref:Lnb N-terminal periplasmic domain-containing protein n=1 Tax=Methyloprofundus sp. TaxID=2020875 RepID=UPI003D0EC1ED
MAAIAAGIFAFAIPLILFLVPQRNLALVIIILSYIAVTTAWMNMPASNDRDWMPSVAKSPYAITQGNQVAVHNIRNFDYRTEFDFSENYYDKTYNLDDLESLNFLLSYWGGGTTFAHTILSFGFSNGDYLAVSAETRLEKGEPQSLVSGFFNQYEMTYILADERDIIRLRTNFRKLDPEDVYFYPTTLSKQEVRQVFEVIMARVNQLYQQPEFYNTITQNCFTTLRADFNSIAPPKNSLDWRIIANGYSDQMLYENGTIDTDLSFPEAREYFHINQYVSDDNSPVDYSKRIRPNLNKPSL